MFKLDTALKHLLFWSAFGLLMLLLSIIAFIVTGDISVIPITVDKLIYIAGPLSLLFTLFLWLAKIIRVKK
mgnify:CR=1 FL=1